MNWAFEIRFFADLPEMAHNVKMAVFRRKLSNCLKNRRLRDFDPVNQDMGHIIWPSYIAIKIFFSVENFGIRSRT